MKLSVYSSKGSKTKKSVDLDDAVFGIEPNDHAIYLDVKRFLAAQRQGCLLYTSPSPRDRG